MNFTEADAKYELVKQRYQAGALTAEELDEQLRALMVLDNTGRWWAKSRENGNWHYYDTASDSWLLATPPVDTAADAPTTEPSGPASPALPEQAAVPNAVPNVDITSSPSATAPYSSAAHAVGLPGRAKSGPGSAGQPKWAAVIPQTHAATIGSGPVPAGGATSHATTAAQPAAGGYGGGYSTSDFGPLPELGRSLKILFYVLSLVVPIVGIVLFLVYYRKPARADRAAARVFLILGVLSLVLLGMCGLTFFLLETVMLGTGRLGAGLQ
jgi:hypothetical protein